MTTFEAADPTGPNLNPSSSGAGESSAEAMAGTPKPHEPEPTTEALAQQARQAVEALARLSDPAAFSELLRLSALVGECLGVSARSLAEGGSWAHVGEVAGVTRQAAWSRWRSDEQAVIESSNAGVPVDHPPWPPGRLGDPDYGSR